MPFLTPSSTPAGYRCRCLHIPDSVEWLELVNGALSELIKAYNWEPFGAATPQEAADRAQVMFLEYLESECMIGAIMPYATVNPPPNCLPCDGSTYQREDYPLLYARIDPGLIVDADQFQTPDLQRRFVFGADEDYTPFSTGGAATVALTENQMPVHAHADVGHVHSTSGTITLLGVVPGEVPLLAPSPIPEITSSSSANIQTSGGGQAHENMPPYTALPYCIVAK